MSAPEVIPIDRLECTAAPWSWAFTRDRRAEIDAFFAAQQRANPALWNGRLLLMHEIAVAERTLRASFFETDYASMIAGIEWGVIGQEVLASFGAAALLSSDRAFMTGRMAKHTRNAGMICFPSGSLEPADVAGGNAVNVEACVRRELEEETGLTPNDYQCDLGWYAVHSGPRMPLFKIVRSSESSGILRDRILANLAKQERPEFSEIYLVRDAHDLHAAMPSWMIVFLNFILQSQR
jgi:8-oxo-dGTP pyrophosphatase MutT (NUDIX family)